MNYNYEFYEAICKGYINECIEIINNYNDVVNKEYNKKYPIFYACENNNYAIVDLLIKVTQYF